MSSSPYAWKLPPERLVDGARESQGADRREWCAMIAESPDARCELDLIAAFEADGELPQSRGLDARIAVAIGGALATLDDDI